MPFQATKLLKLEQAAPAEKEELRPWEKRGFIAAEKPEENEVLIIYDGKRRR
jgi:hypothetical protein